MGPIPNTRPIKHHYGSWRGNKGACGVEAFHSTLTTDYVTCERCMRTKAFREAWAEAHDGRRFEEA